jgi:hypothetical protein
MNNDTELEESSLVAGIAGIICAPIIFALLVVVVCGIRAYKTTFQRLILYHIIIALICECSFALQIQLHFSHPKWLCVIAIYLYMYSFLSWYVYTTAVTNYLFLLTLKLLRGKPKIWRRGKLAECFCVCLSLALPAAYVWIPIRDGTYKALYCDEVYYTKWDKDAIIGNIVILVLCLEVLIVSLTLCSLFCYLRRVYKTQRQLTTLLKYFIYHTGICSVIGLAILSSTYFLYRYYRHPSELLSAIIFYIGGVIEPLALLISAVFQTLLSIRHQNNQYCQSIGKICCKSKRQARKERPYMDTDRNENQTNPSSHPLNQPSYTYFSIPYTGAFTQVTSDEHGIGEHTPLIVN